MRQSARLVPFLLALAAGALAGCEAKTMEPSPDPVVPDGNQDDPPPPAPLGGRGGGSGRGGAGGASAAGGAGGARQPDAASAEPGGEPGPGPDSGVGAGPGDGGARPGDASSRDGRPALPMDAPAPPVTGGPVPPCKFQLCESFEDYAEGGPPAGPWTRTGNIVVSAARAARGARSIRVQTRTGPGETYIRETKTFPATNGAFYTRFFLWIDQQPTKFNHWTVVEASDRAGGLGWVARYGGIMNVITASRNPIRNTFFFNIETHGQGETGLGDPGLIPEKTWHCVEAHFDTPNSEARFWWNGVERPSLHWAATKPDEKWKFRDFKSLAFGMGLYQTVDVPYDVYLDEIAVDDERIGCD